MRRSRRSTIPFISGGARIVPVQRPPRRRLLPRGLGFSEARFAVHKQVTIKNDYVETRGVRGV